MNILLQIAVILLICITGEAVSVLLPFVFPGSICAMFILLILLWTGLVKAEFFNPVGTWLLNNMAFFFLPATVSIMEQFDILSQIWIHVLIIVFVSTIVTFLASAGTAALVIRIQDRIRNRGKNNE